MAHPATPATSDYAPPAAALGRLQRNALIAGIAGLAVAAVGWFFSPAHFFQAYLVGYLSVLSIVLGCMGLGMLHHMSGGAWGLMIRRPLEAAGMTMPLLAVLFVPLAFGIGELYHWSHTDAVHDDLILLWKQPYLNTPFFLARALLYFVVWSFLAWKLSSLSRRQDRTDDPALFRRLQAYSAVGFLALALTLTFASIDWVMSLDPHWFSSLYGLWFLSCCALSGLAFAIVMASWLAARPPLAGLLAPSHFHDYGKLLLAFTMLWAYLSFSQMLLIWSGNLPEEITFYLPRLKGGWLPLTVLLLLGQFILPFLALLSAGLKQRRRTLTRVALWILVMRVLDYYWNVAPTLAAQHGGGTGALTGLWIDVAAVVGLSGIALWYFLRRLAQAPLLPVSDPFLGETLEAATAGGGRLHE